MFMNILKAKLKERTEEVRKKILDIRPHFVPLNIKSVEMGLRGAVAFSSKEAEEERATQGFGPEALSIKTLVRAMKNHVEARHKKVINVENWPPELNNNTITKEVLQKYTPAVVKKGNSIIGVLYPNYNSAYDGLFRNFLRDYLKNYFKDSRYAGTQFTKGVDVGHILGDRVDTPVSYKLNDIRNFIIDNYQGGNRDIAIGIVNSKLNELKAKSTYGVAVEATLTKEFTDKLVALGANIVIVQDRLQNQYEYGSLIESKVLKELTEELLKVNFSRNLVQELEYRLVQTLRGNKPVGTKKSKRLPKETIVPKPIKTIPTTSNYNYKGITLNKVNIGTDLISLQSLLMGNLTERIKANMGSGNREDILNLRTGRFAESVKVERLSESRAGMITAFYSYMKNPYATFSKGGRQDRPYTRDPKLLISKSMREVAASMVANRLRAVAL